MPRRAPGVFEVYYYDLGKAGSGNPLDALFSDKSDKVPPIDAPSGPNNGVLAQVYGCGDCAKANRFIAYLQKFTPEAKKARMAPPKTDAQGQPTMPNPDEYNDMMNGILVASPDKPTDWYLIYSPQGQQITEGASGKCPPGKKLKVCFPNSK